MNLEELLHLSVKQLKEYTKAWGLSTASILEKDDLAKLILSTKLTEDNKIVFKMNRSAAAATTSSSPKSSQHHSAQPSSSGSRTNINQNDQQSQSQAQNPAFSSNPSTSTNVDPITGFFTNIGKGFQEMGDVFKGMGDSFKESMSMKKKRSQPDVSSPRRSNRSEQPQQQSTTPNPAPTYPSSYSTSTPEVPQANFAQPSSSPIPPMDIDPPSITTLATTGLDLNTLSIKALKRILLRERVSTLDINDREELQRRVKLLVDNVMKELNTSDEDNLCKVCCERYIYHFIC